jgi:hypothetical protein
MVRSLLAFICVEMAILFLSADGLSTAPALQVTAGIERPSMARLVDSFRNAKRAEPSELPGTWVEITNVFTETFLTGRSGPDRVRFDVAGIRRDDQPGHPFDWTLTFRTGRADDLQVTSDTAWIPTGDISPVNFDLNGDFTFEKQYGGDARWIYRCRAANSRRLICVLRNHEDGHAVEVLRQAD